MQCKVNQRLLEPIKDGSGGRKLSNGVQCREKLPGIYPIRQWFSKGMIPSMMPLQGKGG